MAHLLDNPLILQGVFFPRQAEMNPNAFPNQFDGLIPVDEHIQLGYRLYKHSNTAPLLLYFHGNGEVASDYNGIAKLYHEIGLSLLVVDYRGYGWSSGKPLITTMLSDAAKAVEAIPQILQQAQIDANVSRFIMGRSLGSAPAIYVAYRFPDVFKALIIESGFADAPSVFKRLGVLIPESLHNNFELPISNTRKLEQVTMPLLVIHGTVDRVLPYENGLALFNASSSEDKKMLPIHGAGHNDLMMFGKKDYFGAIQVLVESHK